MQNMLRAVYGNKGIYNRNRWRRKE